MCLDVKLGYGSRKGALRSLLGCEIPWQSLRVYTCTVVKDTTLEQSGVL